MPGLLPGVSAQEYSYHQYTTKDGLAAETVYEIMQDRQGFLWIGTEAGLSRFDGRNFRNFSTADGLPSDEVLACYEDANGRLWIVCFSKYLCYYKDGKLYHRNNDPLLRKISFEREVAGMIQDRLKRTIVWNEKLDVYIIEQQDSIRFYPESSFKLDYRLLSIGESIDMRLLSLPGSIKKHILDYFARYSIASNDISAIMISDDALLFRSIGSAIVWDMKQQTFFEFDYPYNARFYKSWEGGYVPSSYVGKMEAMLYDYKNKVKKARFLSDIMVNSIFRDRDHNVWFSTRGNGLFRLNAAKVLQVKLSNKPFPVRFIQGNAGGIWVGTENEECWYISSEPRANTGESMPRYKFRKVALSIDWLRANATHTPLKIHHSLLLKDTVGHIKSNYAYDTSLLVTASKGAFVISTLPGNTARAKNIYGRSTVAMPYGNNYYIGTLDGLVIMDKQYKVISRILPYPINYITPGEQGILWVATHGHGVFGLKDHMVVARINEAGSGLSSDLCSTIYASGDELWIGTNKGLNKVVLENGIYPKVKRLFSTVNGLNSDEITAVFALDSTIWVGTHKGLNVIMEEGKHKPAPINLAFTGITVADKVFALNERIVVPHDHNTISFDFSAISFAPEQVKYLYRIVGLNKHWTETKEATLNFLSLPPGAYTLQVKAISALGAESPLIEKHFSVAPKIYETWWFRVLLVLTLGALLFILVRYRIKRIRRQEQEKSDLDRKIAELEQMALRAQMNPHFIFNCLNSVQNYIIKSDRKGASIYLSRFAMLIRMTLDNAGRLYISLKEELAYLEAYIELEKLQANHPFQYHIEVDKNLNINEVAFPNMILQPFVENAVKHGLPYAGAQGLLEVRFILQEDEKIMCIIADNGPGINSAKKQSGNSPAYASKGMSLTLQRIATLNLMNDTQSPIELLIRDLSADKISGTQIKITIPLKLSYE
mgnify:CR=1 FL=1